MPNVTVLYGAVVTKPTDPIRAGYDFGGWYEDLGYTKTVNFSKYKVEKSDTFYAKWDDQ